MPNTRPEAWTIANARETYEVDAWGAGFFGINEAGRVEVRPESEDQSPIDLRSLMDEVRRRGILPPLLIRFADVLRRRIDALHGAFANARDEYGYKGDYRGVYPYKVNQDRWVLERLIEYGRPYHYGLEAGTKPELLTVLAAHEDLDSLIICNGYKDEEYVEAALYARRLGRKVIIVAEKLTELDLIIEVAQRMDVEPMIGVRAKLASRGAGRWQESGGDKAKFGLTSHELLVAVETLEKHDMLGCMRLLHFHLGSQISAIQSVKSALREAARFYVELVRLGAPMGYLDCGGGLGVDYDGSQTNFTSSMNYSLQEYANDVVFYTMEVCDASGVDHPTLVTESGRAVVAHHAVLVTEVLGTSSTAGEGRLEPDETQHPIVKTLEDLNRDVTKKSYLECLHDAVHAKEQILSLFSLGHLSLEQRVRAEDLYWSLCHKVRHIARSIDDDSPELEQLEKALADTYFCNFSIFQSLPDTWAVQQLFPVVPLHRLDEAPTRRGILADITCDSDGKVDRFIGRRDVKDALELHELGEDPYYLGIFLVGAYQESLGDLHNLFGKPNVLSVVHGPSGYKIDSVRAGATVADVVGFVGHSREHLMDRLRQSCEDAIEAERITIEEGREILRFYEAGLAGYTYLERE